MTRSLSIILFAAVAAVAMMASETVDAQASKPECAPIHVVYKSFTNNCTQNGASIPNSDADPRWIPCVCKPGFFPVAQAAEKCVLTGQQPSITAGSLDSICKAFPNYVAASNQTAPTTLAPAVASASALAAAMPTPSAGAGGDGTSGGGGSGKSGTSGAYRMADGSSSVVMVGMTAIAAVVLATAAAF